VTIMPTPEEKTLQARARAIEVWEAMELISRHQSHIRQLLDNHDPSKSDNSTRRDCMAFAERLRDLGLLDRALALAGRDTIDVGT
jgi:hypothetical protein